MIFIFIIITLVLCLCDAYILFGVISSGPIWSKILLLIPPAFYFGVILKLTVGGDIRQSMLNLLFWLTLCIVFPTILFCIFSLMGKGIKLLWNPGAPLIYIVGLAAAAVWFCISLYGIIYRWKKVTVEKVVDSSHRIPDAFK